MLKFSIKEKIENKSLCVKWFEKMKSESAKIGIGRSNSMKNQKSESAKKMAIGASLLDMQRTISLLIAGWPTLSSELVVPLKLVTELNNVT